MPPKGKGRKEKRAGNGGGRGGGGGRGRGRGGGGLAHAASVAAETTPSAETTSATQNGGTGQATVAVEGATPEDRYLQLVGSKKGGALGTHEKRAIGKYLKQHATVLDNERRNTLMQEAREAHEEMEALLKGKHRDLLVKVMKGPVWTDDQMEAIHPGVNFHFASCHFCNFAIGCKKCYEKQQIEEADGSRATHPTPLYISGNWLKTVRFHWQNTGCPHESESEKEDEDDDHAAEAADTGNSETSRRLFGGSTPGTTEGGQSQPPPTEEQKRTFGALHAHAFSTLGASFNAAGGYLASISAHISVVPVAEDQRYFSTVAATNSAKTKRDVKKAHDAEVGEVRALLKGKKLVIAFDGGTSCRNGASLLVTIAYVEGVPVPLAPFQFNQKPDAKRLLEAIRFVLGCYDVKLTDVLIHMTDRDATNRAATSLMSNLTQILAAQDLMTSNPVITNDVDRQDHVDAVERLLKTEGSFLVPVYCVPHTVMNVIHDVVTEVFQHSIGYKVASNVSRALYEEHGSGRTKRLVAFMKRKVSDVSVEGISNRLKAIDNMFPLTSEELEREITQLLASYDNLKEVIDNTDGLSFSSLKPQQKLRELRNSVVVLEMRKKDTDATKPVTTNKTRWALKVEGAYRWILNHLELVMEFLVSESNVPNSGDVLLRQLGCPNTPGEDYESNLVRVKKALNTFLLVMQPLTELARSYSEFSPSAKLVYRDLIVALDQLRTTTVEELQRDHKLFEPGLADKLIASAAGSMQRRMDAGDFNLDFWKLHWQMQSHFRFRKASGSSSEAFMTKKQAEEAVKSTGNRVPLPPDAPSAAIFDASLACWEEYVNFCAESPPDNLDKNRSITSEIKWWKDLAASDPTRFGDLPLFAEVILSTPPQVTQCDSVFSMEGYMFSSNQSTLSEETANELVALRARHMLRSK